MIQKFFKLVVNTSGQRLYEITDETIKAIEALNVPFKHFKTTEVGYIRKEKFI